MVSILSVDFQTLVTYLDEILAGQDSHGIRLHIPPFESAVWQRNVDCLSASCWHFNTLEGSQSTDRSVRISYLT